MQVGVGETRCASMLAVEDGQRVRTMLGGLTCKLNFIINFEIINFLPGQVNRPAGSRTPV